MYEFIVRHHAEFLKLFFILLATACLFFLHFRQTMMRISLVLGIVCALAVFLRGGILTVVLVAVAGMVIMAVIDKLFYIVHEKRYYRGGGDRHITH